jgi:hypothetical protein
MSAGGGVQRIEITERESPVFGATEFAGVGNYERLTRDLTFGGSGIESHQRTGPHNGIALGAIHSVPPVSCSGKPSHGLRGAIFPSRRTALVLASFVFCRGGAMKKMRMIMDDTN